MYSFLYHDKFPLSLLCASSLNSFHRDQKAWGVSGKPGKDPGNTVTNSLKKGRKQAQGKGLYRPGVGEQALGLVSDLLGLVINDYEILVLYFFIFLFGRGRGILVTRKRKEK